MTGFLKTLFGKKEAPAVTTAPTADPAVPILDAEPIHVTDDTFDETILKVSLPALVDFWAPWCGPCRMIAPIVEDLAKMYEGKAVIAKFNTDENVKMASQLGIMGIPTLILFKDGKEVDRVVGFAPRQVLQEKLDAVLS